MNPPPNVALCPLILCAGGVRRDWHRKNSRGIVPLDRRVRRQVHAQRHLGDRLCRSDGQVAFFRAETFSNYLRRRLKPEPLQKHQPGQAARAVPEPGSQSRQAEVEQRRRWAQPRQLEAPWQWELVTARVLMRQLELPWQRELVMACALMRR